MDNASARWNDTRVRSGRRCISGGEDAERPSRFAPRNGLAVPMLIGHRTKNTLVAEKFPAQAPLSRGPLAVIHGASDATGRIITYNRAASFCVLRGSRH